jgi:hypothetical protein
MSRLALIAALTLCILIPACGGDDDSSSSTKRQPDTDKDGIPDSRDRDPYSAENTAATEPENRELWEEFRKAGESEPPACREPDGTEKGALRFEVRAHNRELKDAPWAIVSKGGVNYMAAEIDAPGPRLVVLVSFPESGQYLAGMKAINGIARTFTDLPTGGDAIPNAGRRALRCIGE